MRSLISASITALILGSLALTFSTAFSGSYGSLTFKVNGMDNSRGVVRVVLYDSEKNFLSENGFVAADSAFARANSTVEVTLNHVPFGTYAAAIYQDENQNGVIDQNLVRIPTESYAFSNGVYAKWSVPSFSQVAFRFEIPGEKFETTLKSWSQQ